ncbi:2-oxoglutarate dehydrogenase complex dihydrolipoyllysine-residue succinyltransferase [Alicyclobacillus sp. SO9]|uniref:2-oxoglutarate dehydrogenase complex dihydrolipoyllysine-residue succinyltransferase n=1 Tax=Alicyclobacillus sp. SO9 TaxID=2665646 RepID=UPI0018E8B223|nr:2-oxoglutarate dehydrogenase complex dihydrolipoyllysine-residue succinyltransferase [Alicyclobacillus sp. SO9]QQE78855.1 2-oxoglutarate dehydrogenase complex dihydrolipoyllysine-residue succinyltransferase [Alicyclobacillus sp. SO9]
MGEIKVPELGESILEGTLLQWLKSVGDAVELGEAVAELETDKVNIEVMAEEAGVLESTSVEPGDTVEVGASIGTIAAGQNAAGGSNAGAGADGSSGSDNRGATPGDGSTASDNGGAADGNTESAEAEAKPAQQTSSDAGDKADAGKTTAGSGAGAAAPDGSVPPHTTPAVRRLAKEQGVDLSNVQGSGGLGRITEADVLRQASKGAQPAQGQGQSAAGQPQPQAPSQQGGTAGKAATPAAGGAGVKGATRSDEKRERMSRRRQTIAKRLVEVQQQSAMLTTFNEVDMTNMLEVRKRHKERFKEEHDIGLGFMSFFSKAAVGALKQFPRLNAEIDGQDMILKDHYDIGIAVSTEGGLVVPVVRDVDRLTFAEIEQEVAGLAKKARANNLALSDLQGGTFTITNGGVFGSLFSTPILNAPQVGILGMHTIQQRPVAVNGNVEIRPMMYLALSYDHRIVDGSEAVSFLVAIKKMIEDPERLLLQG